ncbi:MAG: excinuclease ABC subunit UvrC [Nitrosopumilus sp. B06]|nr:MAG: excinuclease ABC subunit UvrC [Nitrosopumilus sp. B06]
MDVDYSPRSPGIYLMKDSNGMIIYIGKAKNLRNRVKSYYTGKQNYKTQKLVQNIADIEYIITDSESEAFLLESNMIKRYRPKFNIELKDQQRYTYLRISDEKYPRLLVARRTRDGKFLGKGKTFGPFTQGSSKLLTIGSLRKAFQIRICKTLPKKVCLEYHLGNCEGPCEFKDAQKRYSTHITSLQEVLRGGAKSRIFATKLKEEMKLAAQSRQFERARDIRDTLIRLGSLKSGQKMEHVKNSDEEYFGIGVLEHTITVMNFRILNGVIRDSDKFFFDLVGDNSFSNFLYQYYTTHKIPRFIHVSVMPENHTLLESLFSGHAGYTVQISVPARGKKKEIIDLLIRNIGLIHSKGGDPGLIELKDILLLPAVPQTIECIDISNHGIDFAVGSMSRFVGGQPEKSGYRKFRIKTVSGRDDYAMIAEVVKRRYGRLKVEGSALPDLILIDGGRGQLGAALKSLKLLHLKIPCISLAKENEEVFVPGKDTPVVIPKNKRSLQILQHARDESHRFGVAYNRTVRKNQLNKK